jgi:conjugal transfer pilus assembly protein TraB
MVTTVDPDSVGEVGLYGGAGRAMEILAERYIEEAESMFPVIEVPSGRRGTVVIQEGQQLEWEAYELADKMPTQE